MAKKRNDMMIESLALHLAIGGKHETFAEKHQIGRRTVYEWARLESCRAMIRRHQSILRERAYGRHVRLLDRAMAVQQKLLGDPAAAVRQRASEFLLGSLRGATELAELRDELDALRVAVEKKGGPA